MQLEQSNITALIKMGFIKPHNTNLETNRIYMIYIIISIVSTKKNVILIKHKTYIFLLCLQKNIQVKLFIHLVNIS